METHQYYSRTHAGEQICEIGRRMYNKGFVAANDGNLSVRIGENQILCTPTQQSKGHLKSDDLVVIDMQGNRIEGKRQRSSEALLHLEVYRNRPDVRCVVHCHPPHVTAFAVAREPIPIGVLPEVEVFLGEVPTAAYETPGTAAFAETIRPYVENSKIIVLSNHGSVSYDVDLETAFWSTEILESYCRILMIAKSLGHIEPLPRNKIVELLLSKPDWGLTDPRLKDWADKSDSPESREQIQRRLAEPFFLSQWLPAKLKPRAFNQDASKSNSKFVRNKTRLRNEDIEAIAQRVAELLKNKAV